LSFADAKDGRPVAKQRITRDILMRKAGAVHDLLVEIRRFMVFSFRAQGASGFLPYTTGRKTSTASLDTGQGFLKQIGRE